MEYFQYEYVMADLLQIDDGLKGTIRIKYSFSKKGII
jgi:hypothetical protein